MQPHHPAPPERESVTLALSGEVDIARQHELGELVTAFRHSGASTVELDLTEVSFLDSTGLTAIMRLRAIAVDRGGAVRLLRPTRTVRRILEISGMCCACELVE